MQGTLADALKTLARNADAFLTLDDAEVETAIEALPPHGLATSPSGGAGFAGLALIDRKAAGLSATSRVVIYLSEGAVDA